MGAPQIIPQIANQQISKISKSPANVAVCGSAICKLKKKIRVSTFGLQALRVTVKYACIFHSVSYKFQPSNFI
jgi:hypothetical protein